MICWNKGCVLPTNHDVHFQFRENMKRSKKAW